MTPDKWITTTIGDVCEFRRGLSWKKTQERDRPGLGRIPVLRIPNVKERLDLSDMLYLEEVRPVEILRTRIGSGWCVLVGSNGNPRRIGNAAIVEQEADFVFASFLIAVGPIKTTGLDSKYLYRLLQWEHIQREITENVQGSTGLKNLNLNALKALAITLPPIYEQRKIAAIISSVDEAIFSTQAVIDQLGVVKKALMAELLTRGIPGRHTKFKQTEIGEVPESWDYCLLDSVASRGSGHTPNKSYPEYWDGDIKWVSLKDSSSLDRLYISDTTAHITPLGIANSSAVEYPPGTVVLSRDAGVGKSAITTETMAVSQHFMAWVCSPRLDNHFLYYLLQFRKPEFERIAIGNTIKTIGLPYFKALKVQLPPLAEQVIASKVLTSIDCRIFEEGAMKERLADLKASLMSVLLTGELRVTPDQDPT